MRKKFKNNSIYSGTKGCEMQYFGMNLTNDMQDQYTERYKNWGRN
jgi:hypothetical protein